MKAIQLLRITLRSLLIAAAGCGTLQAHAKIEGTWGSGTSAPQAAGTPRDFTLNASEGYISAADGVQIYMWGYGEGATGLMQFSGPTLKVRAGETVRVTLTNRLPVTTSLLFPGQVLSANIPAGTTNNNLLTTQVLPARTATYTFIASNPGTYLYQSGTRPTLQTEMGLVGALIVYPANSLTQAYNHADTAFDRENLFVVSDIDANIHQAVDEKVKALRAANAVCVRNNPTPDNCAVTVDTSARFPNYWFLNGRTSPDVFAKNFAGELPHQPYNAVPRLHPGEKILLRMVGAGRDLHPMHHHGNNSWAIARDGRMLSTDPHGLTATPPGPNLAMSDYTIQVVPGQTYDAIWTWSGKGLGWDMFGATCDAALAVSPTNCRFGKYNAAGAQTALPAIVPGAIPQRRYASTQSPITDMYKSMPVKLPSEFELAYGEFYSGSPYLGDFGIRPVGAGNANTTGGFFHMFHSHNEREVVNGGVFPGGMMTMLVVEPFGVVIDTDQP
ncbi:MAG: multicopper oxidase domain-containing protein [Burkholderiaceae bacterium]